MSLNDSFEDFEDSKKSNSSRRVFLLTYSQADLKRFPTCQSFSEMVVDAFESVQSSRTIKEWACCQEKHSDGGFHYHMSISLTGSRRWNPVKEFIYNKHRISVHFSTKTCGYVAAYRYVCKDKNAEDVLHSQGHTHLEQITTPKTNKAMRRFSESRKEKRKSICFSDDATNSGISKPAIKKRLTNADVAALMVKENITGENELMRLAYQRNQSGEGDLHNFILNKSPKALSDLVATTWKMQNAQSTLLRQNKERMEIIREYAASSCISGCDEKWYKSAKQVLANNNINLYYFACAMRQALTKGRQKNTNILIVGPTNCGKSFLLNPLELVFKAFINPATSKYAWIGLDECEIAFLNDFRWSSEIISWSDFLLLLEGQTVHLPRPKNQFASDMLIHRSNTIPFFATSKTEIEYIGRYNERDQRESDMMSSRWMTFKFFKQIEKPEHIEPCPKCFAKFVMEGHQENVDS